MRGLSATWTRIRVSLEQVPEPLRPAQEALDPDYDPWAGFTLSPARSPGARSGASEPGGERRLVTRRRTGYV